MVQAAAVANLDGDGDASENLAAQNKNATKSVLATSETKEEKDDGLGAFRALNKKAEDDAKE